MEFRNTRNIAFLAAALCLVLSASYAHAGQGCPLDQAACEEYCSKQGCSLGYCGHFAWVQCICKKCGDEWNYYDKVQYNPDKQVNQTELESLKLNRREPLILTSTEQQQQQQQQQKLQASKEQPSQRPEEKKRATLTTLLIPDLSEGLAKLDLNDIPDENSEKFLDFLAKNHEKLVEASSSQLSGSRVSQTSEATTTTTVATPTTEEAQEEVVEIQVSTSNNSSSQTKRNGSGSGDDEDDEAREERDDEKASAGPMRRLLRMTVIDRSLDEIERRR